MYNRCEECTEYGKLCSWYKCDEYSVCIGQGIEDKIIKIEAPKQYPTNNAKANWEFVTKMKTGDIVFVKKGFEDILIGRGVVTSDYIYDNSRQEYKSIRKIKWTHNGHYKVNFGELGLTHWNTKVLTEISQTKFGDFCLQLEDIFMDKKISNINSVKHPLNLILYGPPGTGKTFETKNIMKDILCNNKIFVTQKTTKNITGDTPWWQAIALTMYKHNKNKKYKVAELEKLLKDYIKLKQNNTVKINYGNNYKNIPLIQVKPFFQKIGVNLFCLTKHHLPNGI